MREKRRVALPGPAAVLLTGAALMLTVFVAGELAPKPLDSLPPAAGVTGGGHSVRGGQVDINTAGIEELDALPGIGPKRAEAIIAWRREHGPFRYPEQLLAVPGIGEDTLAGLLDQIKVGGN